MSVERDEMVHLSVDCLGCIIRPQVYAERIDPDY